MKLKTAIVAGLGAAGLAAQPALQAFIEHGEVGSAVVQDGHGFSTPEGC